MAEKLKVGIIGVGAIGSVHAEAYQATGAAEVTAICDIDEPKLQAKGKQYDVGGRFVDYRDLLKSDVDAVDVCTPNYLHREMVVAALEAGKKVLVEKPMALNGTEAAKIVEAQKRTGGLVQVGMVRRQTPEAQLLRGYIEQGLLGEIYHMRANMIRHRGIPGMGGWFTTADQSGGGPIIDLGVHWFDMCLWLSGLWNPVAVSGKMYAKFGPDMQNYKYVSMWAGPPKLDGVFDVEDYATGFVRFDTGATLSFEIAWAANAESESFVEIMGEKGGMRVLDGKPLRLITEQHGTLADVCPQIQTKVNHFHVQAQKFAAACRGECPPAATARQGFIVNTLIDAVRASSEQDREVPVTL